MKNFFIITLTALIAAIAFQVNAIAYDEAHYLYIDDNPYAAQPGWHENANGITNDGENWYITQEERLFKIPVDHDLSDNPFHDPGTRAYVLGTDVQLLGYHHFGDLTHYEINGHHYLAIPVDKGDGPPLLAIIEYTKSPIDGFVFVGRAELPRQTSAGWCAINPKGDPKGCIYSSNSTLTALYKYSIDWEALANHDPWALIPLSGKGTVNLKDENGNYLELHHMQGGVFSESGGLFYLTNGYMTGDWGDETMTEAEMRLHGGIHVFDTQNWERIQKSTNGYGYFNFEFYPECSILNHPCEEPEGLTIWDLDKLNKPHGISGQLHVLMIANDEVLGDDVYLKHYTNKLYVNCGAAANGNGKPDSPFNNLADAVGLAWDGATIMLSPVDCSGTISINKKIKLDTTGGTASIGR